MTVVVGISVSIFTSFMLEFNPSVDVPETFIKDVIFALVAEWAL